MRSVNSLLCCSLGCHAVISCLMLFCCAVITYHCGVLSVSLVRWNLVNSVRPFPSTSSSLCWYFILYFAETLVYRPFSTTARVFQCQNVSILDFIGTRMMEAMVTAGAVRRAMLESNHHYQQTNFSQAGCPSHGRAELICTCNDRITGLNTVGSRTFIL